MECPHCYYKFDGFSRVCEICGYEFQDDDTLFIGKYIDKYNLCKIKPIEFPSDKSEIHFKNVMADDIDDVSPEDFVINYYKQLGFNAFFAENKYWLLLFLIIYFPNNILGYRFVTELDFATNLHSDQYVSRIKTIDFKNKISNSNLKEDIITTYFKSLKSFSSNNYYQIFEEGYSHIILGIDDLLSAACHLNIEQLALIFERMGDDFKYYTLGLPDLIVYNDTEFFFVEVKSHDDKPSFKQIQWHKYLVDVVNVDVVIFTINKTNTQIENIKKMYDVELLNSKNRQSLQTGSIDWGSFQLDSSDINVTELNQMLMLNRYGNFDCMKSNKFTKINKDTFGDINQYNEYRNAILRKNANIIYKKTLEVYSVDYFIDYRSTKIQLSRNKKAKLMEDKGDYVEAIKLYLDNVYEKTASPTTYKRLINIYRKFDKYEEIVKLMDIAIPIFIGKNDKKNVLYFLFNRFNKFRLSIVELKMIKLIDEDTPLILSDKKEIQTDLSNYFN